MSTKYISLILGFVLLSCQKESNIKYRSVEKDNHRREIFGDAYGSTFGIVYYSEIDFSDEIVTILDDFDQLTNTYVTNSDLTQWNKSSKGFQNKKLYNLAQEAYTYYQKTEGYFDPTVTPLMQLWGFNAKEIKNKPQQAQIDSVMQFVGFEKIKFSPSYVEKKHPQTQLSFNAMTGYVNDQIGTFFKEKNVQNYLIEIGGEILAHGKKSDGKLWQIGIDNPVEGSVNSGYGLVIPLDNEALATSGNYRKFIEIDGEKIVHTMNPKTGKPKQSPLLSVSVLASSCSEADATATALMAMGLEKAIKYLEKYPVKAYLIWDEQGKWKQKNFNDFK